MKDIQEWLGHSELKTTSETYAHIDSSSKENAASVMESLVTFSPTMFIFCKKSGCFIGMC